MYHEKTRKVFELTYELYVHFTLGKVDISRSFHNIHFMTNGLIDELKILKS